ncbi:Ecotin precursor [Planctomycetes bacterium MalM25]|nr:Ecotin precursor [Planctomycetes bacterium MalM25]
MKILLPTLILMALLVAARPAIAEGDDHPAAKNLKAFSAAADGRVRYVVLLSEKTRDEEADLRVELLIGKTMMSDGVNTLRMGGEIVEQNVEGWGFTRYEVPKFGPAASTLMAVPPGTPQVEKFVAIPSKLVRYNSRIPLVVYVPEGGEVRYRVWTASETTAVAEPG